MKIFITTPSFSVHGGIRIIMEWANRLSEHHEVTLYSLAKDHCNWFSVSDKVKLAQSDNLSGQDCLIITSPHSIYLEDRKDCPKKVFLFMQMCEHLFKPHDKKWLEQCRKFYSSRHPMIHGSVWGEEMIKTEFGRSGFNYYVGNGVNLLDFPVDTKPKDGKVVLVEGWECTNPAKDINHIANKVASRLHNDGYTIIAYSQLPLRTMPTVPHKYYCRPSLEKMNELYSRATILLKASKYDARALAPMEVMTKGTVTVRAAINADDDLIHLENCLRCNYDENQMYLSAQILLQYNELREQLAANGLDYVQRYSWNYWMPKINKIISN